MNDKIKKNLLDLHFQKNLVICSTLIILAFTYLIAVLIAFATEKLTRDNTLILFISSVVVLGLCALFFFKALQHLKKIPKFIKELNIK